MSRLSGHRAPARPRGRVVHAFALLAWALTCAAAAAQPTRPEPLMARIEALEQQGNADSLKAARALDQLLPQTAPFRPARLDLLTVRGNPLAIAQDEKAAEALAQ